MEWSQVVVLSLLQGITEFLPVSSAAHLILTPYVFNWPDQGLAFDVAAHVGTLTAVMIYFRTELRQMILACAKDGHRDARLGGQVIIASLPALLIGAVLHDVVASSFRDPLVIAAATIGFGLLLLLANHERAAGRDEYDISYVLAIGIGLAQVLAFIPGTSRSGVTMTAAVLLGMRRDSAARFSFLLSMPLILGGGIYKTMLMIQAEQGIDWSMLGLAVALSAVSALACIHWFLRFIRKFSFTPFVVYRLLLGVFLLVIFV